MSTAHFAPVLRRLPRLHFPVADERLKFVGGDHELRTSILIREHPIRGDGHVDFLGESEGSLPQPHDSFLDAVKRQVIFWSMLGNCSFRHLVEPRVKLYSPIGESFPIPLKYIDVEKLIRIWKSSKRSASMIIGISMGQKTCLIFGQVSHNLLYWKKNRPTDICGPG